MNCLRCETPLKPPNLYCRQCGIRYTQAEFIEITQLEYLLQCTANWPNITLQRAPYQERWRAILAKFNPPPPVIQAAPEPLPVETATPVEVIPQLPMVTPPPVKVVAEPPPPPEPAIPFEQWLLSETNIKFALYSGGFLVVLAGLIFIGANWSNFSGLVKLLIMGGITASMYASGTWLFTQPKVQLGGVALLAVASGFLPLNFIVLQLYFLDMWRMPYEVTWLMASLVCGVVYGLTAYFTRHPLFAYMGISTIFSGLSAVLTIFNASFSAYLLIYTAIPLPLVIAAWTIRGHKEWGYFYWPLLVTSQVTAPMLFLTSTLAWGNYQQGDAPNAWVSLIAMFASLSIFVADDLLFGWSTTRWLTAFLSMLTISLSIIQLGLSFTATGLFLLGVAFIYLNLGTLISSMGDDSSHKTGWPLYSAAYSMTVLVTAVVTLHELNHLLILEQPTLTAVLFGDALILAVSWLIFRQNIWLYGVAWLLPIPIWLMTLYFGFSFTFITFLMLAVALAYQGVGFILRQLPQSDGQPMDSWAFYSVTYALAIILTGSTFAYELSRGDFWHQPLTSLILLADVFILATSWLILRENIWLYGATWLLPLPVWLMTQYFDIPFNYTALFMMIYAMMYQGLGFTLPRLYRRAGQTLNPWAFYTVTYLLGLAVTCVVLLHEFQKFNVLSEPLFSVILLADVLILATSWLILGEVMWLYTTTWLLIIPVGLLTKIYWPLGYWPGELASIGLVLSWLMSIYAVTGHAVGRYYSLNIAGAFLSPLIPLSGLVVMLTFDNHPLVTVLLLWIACLYGLTSVWLKWTWLMLPMQAAITLALLTGWLVILPDYPRHIPISLSYTVLGLIWLAIAVGLGFVGRGRWSWSFYLMATLTLVVCYLNSFLMGQPYPIYYSFVFGALALLSTYPIHTYYKLPPISTYLGLFLCFIGHFVVMDYFKPPHSDGGWPPITAAFCAMYVILSWLPLPAPFHRLYSQPLWQLGLTFMLLPLMGLLTIFATLKAALTFAIIGSIIIFDAVWHGRLAQGYLGSAAFVGLCWSLAAWLHVTDMQAYIMPFGVWLLIIALIEYYLQNPSLYWLLSLSALSLLLGSAFVQSLKGSEYGVLLLGESLLVLVWGAAGRSRLYVQLAVVALVVNGFFQFQPAFAELPRFVQIGTIGLILLGGGLLTLFQREFIKSTYQVWQLEWQKWNP